MLIFVCVLSSYVYSVKSSRELGFIVTQKTNSNKVFLSYLILSYKVRLINDDSKFPKILDIKIIRDRPFNLQGGGGGGGVIVFYFAQKKNSGQHES